MSKNYTGRLIEEHKSIYRKELTQNKKPITKCNWFFVGVAGFEPAASTSQTWRDNRATLHPEMII